MALYSNMSSVEGNNLEGWEKAGITADMAGKTDFLDEDLFLEHFHLTVFFLYTMELFVQFQVTLIF